MPGDKRFFCAMRAVVCFDATHNCQGYARGHVILDMNVDADIEFMQAGTGRGARSRPPPVKCRSARCSCMKEKCWRAREIAPFAIAIQRRTRKLSPCAKPHKSLATTGLTDTTLYVTIEPCSMCAGAMIQARVPRWFMEPRNRVVEQCNPPLKFFRIRDLNHRVQLLLGSGAPIAAR